MVRHNQIATKIAASDQGGPPEGFRFKHYSYSPRNNDVEEQQPTLQNSVPLLQPQLQPQPQESEVSQSSVSSRAPPNPMSYIAVRSGSNRLRNCIFASWEDAKEFLQDPNAAFSVCSDLASATLFAFGGNHGTETGVATAAQPSHGAPVGGGDMTDLNADSFMEQILPSETLVSTTTASDTVQNPSRNDTNAVDVTTGVSSQSGGGGVDQEGLRALTEADVQGNTPFPKDMQQQLVAEVEEKHLPLNSIMERGQPPQAQHHPTLQIASTTTPTITSNSPPTNTTRTTKKRKRGERRPTQRELHYADQWETNFALYAEYIKQQGTCQVPSNGTPALITLSKWVNQQRQEYRKLQSKEKSKLTAKQMQRLVDVGFSFKPKRSYATWETRLKQVRDFKLQYGHAKIPVNHPTLGSWVHSQRREYKNYLNKDPNTRLNEQRLRELQEVDFVFEVAKRTKDTDARSNSKSWEERFEELKRFKEDYG